jgi:branched-chain amino acid aminotransferase
MSRFIHRIAPLIMKIMLRIWNITPKQNVELNLTGSSSLDAVTRQLPDGYYSTFRTYDGCSRVLGLKSHLRRLYDNVTSPDVNASFLRRQLNPLLGHFRPDEARVRLIMTKQGQVYVAAEPLKLLSNEVYDNGVRVETAQIQRESPHLKSTAFIGASDSERKHIAQEGIFEALLVKNGKILEGMTSNFFYRISPRAERSDELSPRSIDEVLVFLQPRASSTDFAKSAQFSAQHDIIYTARHGILLGVTRRTVLHLARGRGVDVKYQPLKLNELSDVDEAFITSSSRGVVPVVQIDEAMIGQGRPGQITRMLMRAYDEYVLKHAEKI